jgi:cyclopropane fatty-acyl-phospholipid synthase-like methyltransferase
MISMHSDDYNIKKLVESGYDRISERYLAWSSSPSPRLLYLQQVLDRLPERAQVVELGCGAGVPATRFIAERAHVTGVDISAAQIALARRYVPDATFIQADMMTLEFPPLAFDAVVALYSIIHVPRVEQAMLIPRLAEWLRLHGQLLMNLGISDEPGFIDPDWLGTPMYWSNYDADTYLEMIRQAGLTLVEAKIIEDDEDGTPVRFLWIWAEKTRSGESE